MASDIKIYSLYKCTLSDGCEVHYLLRVNQPSFSNTSQVAEENAIIIHNSRRDELLRLILQSEALDTDFSLELVGEFQGFPIGDVFYSDIGPVKILLYYMQTSYGSPWIILGTASSESAFLREVNDDDEILILSPVGKPICVIATYLTEHSHNK